MRGGDISNRRVPRILIEFEGLLAVPPKDKPSRTAFFAARKLRRWSKVADLWQINDQVANVINHVFWNLDYEVDVITTGPEEFAKVLADRLSDKWILFNRVWHYSPDTLARLLVTMPDVAAVYTASRQHALLYGSRGRHVTDATIPQIGRF